VRRETWDALVAARRSVLDEMIEPRSALRERADSTRASLVRRRDEASRALGRLLVAGPDPAGPEAHCRRGREARGVLTAEELATLDLTGVRWAVLSACDTTSAVRAAARG